MTDIIFPPDIYMKIRDHLTASHMNWIDIYTPKIYLSIENRNHYCDRGRFIVKADTINFKSCDDMIDHQDGFPRYYYDFGCMMMEVAAFLRAKKQPEIINVKYSNASSLENTQPESASQAAETS